MKTILIVISFSLLLSCTHDVKEPSGFVLRVDEYMKAHAEFNNFSGAILIARNDTIILNQGYGLADHEWNISNTAETKFQIASNTKQFTAACILQLEEQGKLSLDDTLGKYIPGFEYGDTVTLHMMLTHSSGITDYFRFDEFAQRQVVISKDSMISLLKTKLFDFLPGSDLNYSNSNYFLLALIIEKVSGESFEDYLSNHILKVAGMKNTGIVHYDTVLSKRAHGYLNTPGGMVNAFDEAYRSDLMFGCGSMYSTTEDMYKWEKALNGNSILSETSKRKMFYPYGFSIAEAKRKAEPSNTMGGEMDPFWYKLGYGVFIDTFLTHQRRFSRGGTSGFNSTVYSFPNEKSYVIVLQNNEENPDRFAEALTAILFGSEFTIPYRHLPYNINPDNLKKFTGKWVGKIYDDQWIIETLVIDNKLYRRTEGFPDLELIPEAENRFYYSDGQDKVLEFVINEAGEVIHAWFVINGIKFRRDKIE